MKQHTPGPWVSEDEDIFGCDELLATAYPMKNDGVFESWRGNARLIAAAPDMLKALKLASDNWDTKSAKKSAEAWNSIQAAIRLAESGEAQ